MPQTKEQRQRAAKILLEQRTQRTPQEQLNNLDSILGIGIGATKERRRLHSQIKNDVRPG